MGLVTSGYQGVGLVTSGGLRVSGQGVGLVTSGYQGAGLVISGYQGVVVIPGYQGVGLVTSGYQGSFIQLTVQISQLLHREVGGI